jgi:hypothetical protein
MHTCALIAVTLLTACRPDSAPNERPISTAKRGATPHPRKAKLPVLTKSNVLPVTTQLRAESAWKFATEADTLQAWDAAGDLFTQARDECTSDCSELAYSAVLARSRAVSHDPSLERQGEKPIDPQPIPQRVEALISASDAYVATVPGSDESAGVAFLAGKAFNDYGWLDESVARFGTLVEHHPTHEVSEYSANLLLDAFNRRERYDELVQFARMFAANPIFMGAHPDLAETVRAILRQAR